jgi:hypothetical protein
LADLWTDTQQTAFDALKAALTDEATLAFPDLQREFWLWCDASDEGLGAVLMQRDNEGRDRPVEFASKLLSKREQGYTVTEREALAIVLGVKHFRHYLHGTPFKLVTDHIAVTWMMKHDNPKGRVARWVVALQEFDYEVIHRPGSANAAADAMSRPTNTEGNENQPDLNEELPNPLNDLVISRVMPERGRKVALNNSASSLKSCRTCVDGPPFLPPPLTQTNYEMTQRMVGSEAGSCAVTALVTKSAGAMHLFCANAGDCRAVLYSGTGGGGPCS